MRRGRVFISARVRDSYFRRMPTRKRPPHRSEAKRAKSEIKRTKTASPAQIDRLRDRYVEMIALARKLDAAPSAMIDNAHRLLTRHWGYSDWAARAAILKSVDWLLKVAMIHPGAPKDAHPAAEAHSPVSRGARES